MKKLKIPAEIFNTFFFSENEVVLDETSLDTVQITKPFIHDIAYFANLETVLPWEEPSLQVPLLLQEWERLQTEIRELFQHRKNQATFEPMKQGISLLIEFIFWTNGVPVQGIGTETINKLKIKPVNFFERIQFLMQRPNIYPSFKQLIELFEEHEKQYSKVRAIDMARMKRTIE